MRQVAAMIVLVGFVGAGAAPLALAQGGARQPPPPQRRGRGAAAPNPQRAQQQVEQMWNAFFLSRAQEQLQLSDDQFAKFFLRVQRLQRLRQQHQMRRRRLLAELGTLTAPAATTDDATLSARTRALDALDRQAARNEQAALAAIDAVLTVRQRARFRWFEDAMERQKLQMLARALRAGTPAPPERRPAAGGR